MIRRTYPRASGGSRRALVLSCLIGGLVAPTALACSDDPAEAAGGAAPASTVPDAAANSADAGPDAQDLVVEQSIQVTTSPSPLATVAADGEAILEMYARAVSPTSWAEKGNEAVVLEVLRGDERIGHIVLHQGQDLFRYAMTTGVLKAGDALTVRVSDLTAPKAMPEAIIANVTLSPPTEAAAEGVAHAPIIKWPRQKSFDDLPMVLGWSKAKKSYQLAFTHENGGTVALCGGGAKGMRSEIARWGRGCDIERVWSYDGEAKFKRCTGSGVAAEGSPRMTDAHPIFYYGDGHNSLFESRAGYGNACGSGNDKTPDGDLQGWNVDNPGSEIEKDDPFTIVLRPVPVDLDAIGFAELEGRREAIVDTYAPWLYRITDSELAREGRIDGTATLPMSRYLFVDVYADDVNGSGDETCGPQVNGGFRLRVLSKDGRTINGPQMTADFFGGGGTGVKRIAVPLPADIGPMDIGKFIFDAYDNDGMYFFGIGDAFIPKPSGSNGAVLEYVNQGKKTINVYVDDDSGSCVNGHNTKNGVAYPCVGSDFTFAL